MRPTATPEVPEGPSSLSQGAKIALAVCLPLLVVVLVLLAVSVVVIRCVTMKRYCMSTCINLVRSYQHYLHFLNITWVIIALPTYQHYQLGLHLHLVTGIRWTTSQLLKIQGKQFSFPYQ